MTTRPQPQSLTSDPQPTPQAEAVAAGVLRLKLPLPFALNHINVWALEDGDGWVIVDTGLATRTAKAAWDAALAGPMGGRPVRRVVVTHMHPDHVGLAGWLTERFDCRLWMTRLEYLTCRVLVADTGRPAPQDGVRFYRAAGWSEEQIAGYQARFGQFGARVHALPESYSRLSDGQVLSIGGCDWTVIIGNGHSPEHACLYRESDKVLISGDQLLPAISSNVSVWPTEPDADPLSDWLGSLARIKGLIAADTLVLPSHGEPFATPHARLDHLIEGHERALERLEKRLAKPARAVDVYGALFRSVVDDGNSAMATGEAVAHLNWLQAHGRAVGELDADGVRWWRAAG